MILISDKAQKSGKHLIKENYWKRNGVEVIFQPLPVGDYVIGNDKVMDVIRRKESRGIETKKLDFLGTYDVVCDSKRDIGELAMDVCSKDHERFRDSAILAQNNGIKLYIVVENEDGITCLDELDKWQNPRLIRWLKINNAHKAGKMLYVKQSSRPPVNGERLQKACRTMEQEYAPLEFIFTTPQKSGAKILELLTRQDIGNNPYQE